MDDIVIKTRNSESLLLDLEVTFTNLRANRVKLNPEKRVFGVSVGKLLGFLVSHRGIEVNPDKVKAIKQMRPPTRLNNVQRLTLRLWGVSYHDSNNAHYLCSSNSNKKADSNGLPKLTRH